MNFMSEKRDNRMDDDHQKYIPGVQEKTTLGGKYNTGVTSHDPEEKDEIEKERKSCGIKTQGR